MEIIIWKVIMGILIILNLPMFPWFVKNYNQCGVGDFLANLNWSAIIAAVAVGVSLIALWFQRRDLKKQAKYQRDTFILQNTLNRDSITFGMAGDIVGNIQTQVQVMEMLYRQNSMLNSCYKYTKDNGTNTEEHIKQIQKLETSIDELNNSRKDLTNDLTSKGNSLQFHMSGEEELKEINSLFSSIEGTLEEMSDDISRLEYNNEIPSKNALDSKLKRFDTKVYTEVEEFQKIMFNLKLNSLDKLSKIN